MHHAYHVIRTHALGVTYIVLLLSYRNVSSLCVQVHSTQQEY